MTTTQPGPAAPGSTPGADLAREALQAARLAAKKHGATPTKRAKVRKGPARGEGREVLTFSAALAAMMEARGWQAPAAGGHLADRWPDIAPELADHVRPGRLDAESGTLELLPDSPAYATQLRLTSQHLIARINAALSADDRNQQRPGGGIVRSIRILAPGRGPASPAAPEPATPNSPQALTAPGTVHTREDASAGYHQALALNQAHRRSNEDRLAPAVRAAIERQTEAIHALSRRAFPEIAPEEATSIQAARYQRRRQTAATEAAALRRARAEKAVPKTAGLGTEKDGHRQAG